MAPRDKNPRKKNVLQGTFRAPKSDLEHYMGSGTTKGGATRSGNPTAARPDQRASDQDSEEVWLRRSKVDREKFFYFYEKYFDAIYRFVYWKTLDRQVAEDLTADTFVKALEKLGEFEWKGYSFGTWLYRIALNETSCYHRRVARHRVGRVDDFEEFASPQQNPLTQLILSEEQQQVYRGLEELGSEARDLFVLYYWEGLTLRKIAGILEKNFETVKSQLQRARKVMAAKLAEFDENGEK